MIKITKETIMEKEILTVGDLRKALTGVPDNMPIRFIQDADSAYGACSEVRQDSFIELKNEYCDEEDIDIFKSYFDDIPDDIPDDEINNKAPCLLIFISNHDFWDFEDDEYQIKDGVKNQTYLTRQYHDKNERS